MKEQIKKFMEKHWMEGFAYLCGAVIAVSYVSLGKGLGWEKGYMDGLKDRREINDLYKKYVTDKNESEEETSED